LTMSNSEFELPVADRELLARARRSRLESRAPDVVRERVLARSMEEARHGRQSFAIPTAELLPIARRPSRNLGLAGALTLGVLAAAYARNLPSSRVDQALVGPERPRRGASDGRFSNEANSDETSSTGMKPRSESAASARAGERLLETPLFSAPARMLEQHEQPRSGPNLFGDRPFSALSQAWQVRRWNNLGADPAEPAVSDFDEEALCVTLEAGERAIGGWPWAPSDVVPPDAVALVPRQAYRLEFKAWGHEPLPAQVLVAVGHSRLPFSAAAGARVPVSTQPRTFAVDFAVESADPSVGIAF